MREELELVMNLPREGYTPYEVAVFEGYALISNGDKEVQIPLTPEKEAELREAIESDDDRVDIFVLSHIDEFEESL